MLYERHRALGYFDALERNRQYFQLLFDKGNLHSFVRVHAFPYSLPTKTEDTAIKRETGGEGKEMKIV